MRLVRLIADANQPQIIKPTEIRVVIEDRDAMHGAALPGCDNRHPRGVCDVQDMHSVHRPDIGVVVENSHRLNPVAKVGPDLDRMCRVAHVHDLKAVPIGDIKMRVGRGE